MCKYQKANLFVLLFFMALIFCWPIQNMNAQSAQKHNVTGMVVDANGEPLIGVTVKVSGSNAGAITDVNGNFSIQNVPNTSSVSASYVGYVTKTIKVGNQSNFKITLTEDTRALEEVVVVGYGVQKKSDVTGAMISVGEKQLNTKPVANAFEALQGKAAGVDITSSERPGTLGSVRIRGNRSLNATNSPLYVVDGVPLSSGGIETLNPTDIESIDILKDASSTAIYGSRGANGVILVTTKRGKQGALQLSYSSSVTFETIQDKSPAMSASDYITWRRWAYYNSNPTLYTAGDQPTYEQDQKFFSGDEYALANVNKGWVNNAWDGSKVTDTDWTDFVTRTGVTTEHSIRAQGGTDKIQSSFSFGYLSNKGTQKGQEYNRYNVSLSSDLQAKPWFKMGGSVNASWSVQKYGYSRTGQSSSSGPVDLYSAAKAIPRYAVPYDDAGNIINDPAGSTTNVYTVINEWNKSKDDRETFRALGSFYGQMDFGKIWKPLEGLSYRIAFGPDFRYYRDGIFISQTSAVKMGSKNYAKYNPNRYFSWTLDNQINYDKSIGDHHFGLTLLQSASKYNAETGSMSASAIPNEAFEWYNMGSVDITDAATYGASIGTGITESQLSSYMARLNYSYKDRYLLTVSGRYDGSSVLAKGNKWDFFPSAAIGWRIDQEKFMKDVSWVHQLKLRLGIGTTGNSAVDPYSTLGEVQSFYVPFGANLVQAYATNEPYYTSNDVTLANKNLSWEKTTQYNIGLDFSLFDGRLGGTIDVYTSKTKDLLMSMTIPTLTGYSSTLANIGKTENKGIDITIDAIPVQIAGFEWNTIINAAYAKDKITELSNGKEDDITNAWFIGKSIGVYYGYDNDGLWQESDADEMAKFNANGYKFTAGNVRPKDQNGDYKIDDQDRVILGNKNPKWTLGWTNTFTYKGLELNVEMFGRFGYMVNPGGEGQLGMYNQREISYWTPTNTNADYQKPIYNTSGGDAYSSLLGFKKASFIKLRNVSLGYFFPSRLCKTMGISNLKIYAQLKNIGNLYSSVDFMDLDTGTTYYNRGVTFGLQVGF